MNQNEKKIKVAILDDSEFYNRLLTQEIENYCKILSLEYQVDFEIKSFYDSESFLNKIDKDLDIAFVDYYLGKEINGADVTRQIKKKCGNCKVVIISQANTTQVNAKTKKSGATLFIPKDKDALENACFSLRSVAANSMAYG